MVRFQVYRILKHSILRLLTSVVGTADPSAGQPLAMVNEPAFCEKSGQDVGSEI